jgi:hypothetical protein
VTPGMARVDGRYWLLTVTQDSREVMLTFGQA